ncbi:MAG: phosphoenolpyruvate--protein phosphotransferase [Candidatus Edwardsbacteria bacterium]
MNLLKGIAVSPGIAIGRVFFLPKEDFKISEEEIAPAEISREIEKLHQALKLSKEELSEIKFQEKISDSFLEPQILFLDDSQVMAETVKKIKQERKNAAFIFTEVTKKVINSLSKSENLYLKERITDIKDVVKRVISHLVGHKAPKSLREIDEESIVVAHELSPSETAQLPREKVKGFATEIGGRTSHTAIMARSLEIPAVVGIPEISKLVKSGDLMVVDGNKGIVMVNPKEKELEDYRRRQKEYLEFLKENQELKELPAVTLDEYEVEVAANIELPEEVESVISHGAKGIGLFRTEFLYLTYHSLPNEEEQYKIYKMVAEKIAPEDVIIRTFDLGGDKLGIGQNEYHEINPFLGWRAIRFCLAQPEIFKTQLRAILKASTLGNVKIMLPMISDLTEVKRAKEIIAEVRMDLQRRDIEFDSQCPVGIMIETPAAALCAADLAKEVDFFSIGSNDLTQYVLAVDRANERVAYLYEHLHPAVLRLIKEVIDIGHQHQIWVGLCGEMSAEPLVIPILLGFGIDELSMSPLAVPETKRIIRSFTLEEAREISEKVLSLTLAAEIKEYVGERIQEKAIKIIFEK